LLVAAIGCQNEPPGRRRPDALAPVDAEAASPDLASAGGSGGQGGAGGAAGHDAASADARDAAVETGRPPADAGDASGTGGGGGADAGAGDTGEDAAADAPAGADGPPGGDAVDAAADLAGVDLTADTSADGAADTSADGTAGATADGAALEAGGPAPPVEKVETTPTACTAAAATGAVTFEKIARWRDDARAAYAMIHDDMCGPGLRGIDGVAVPALAARGLTAGLGPFAQACEQGKLWPEVAAAEALGNEIVNHSYSHPNVTAANAPQEVVMAKSIFDAHLRSPISFYVFPYDSWTAETLQAVEAAGHIGARAGARDAHDAFTNPPVNGADALNDMTLVFDVWPRAYSKYALYAPRDLLDVHVHNAIERNGFAIREFHGVSTMDVPPEDGSEGFGPVPLRTYEAHLDFLVKAWKANLVWTSTPSTIVRYRQARRACTASVAGSTIVFGAPGAVCTRYATPISVIVRTANDVPGLSALQQGAPVMVRKLGAGRFSVTADPTRGNVELAGCATAVPAVDPSVTVPPKPVPVSTVCDLERVRGAGGAGRMDDLERDATSLFVLPNPAQQDGRTGSWSSYPAGASVQIESAGTSRVLGFSGANLQAWAGATLAFLGGNGAGSCYDATAYQGIRFKVRGTVTTTDLFQDTVFVSLVTAETQSQSLGGDLLGSGGHFHELVTITSEWKTVSIPWNELAKPTWGATTGLAAPAVGKLQAIDWGVSDKATSFNVELDDIELY
jgi:hypothetical protein